MNRQTEKCPSQTEKKYGYYLSSIFNPGKDSLYNIIKSKLEYLFTYQCTQSDSGGKVLKKSMKNSSHRNKVLIDSKVIRMMIKVSCFFSQPHSSNSFMVLQIINATTITHLQTIIFSKTSDTVSQTSIVVLLCKMR